jgi:Uma2 family endonuclease
MILPMAAALKPPPRRMTVAEFLDWDPRDGSGRRWQLCDGEPEPVAPASIRHGRIQGRLAYLISAHLDRHGNACSLIVAPGVVPHAQSDTTMLIPDIGITCDPAFDGRAIETPVLLIEILSPSNGAQTRANIRAYATIPSVAEILVLHTAHIRAELLRRGPDGVWPDLPRLLGADDELRIASIGFAAPLRAAYVGSGLS